MKIVVCIKQVPDTKDIKWTKNNTIKRDSMDSVLNPFDEFAIETALRLKNTNNDIEITTISMGPNQAEKSLRDSLAVGCDKALLLCDKKFSGSDTVATSRTISCAIKKEIPDFSLIICGQFATDGDTAQTGVGIAEQLNLPQATYVKAIKELNQNEVVVEKEGEYGLETIKLQLPALICMQKCDYDLRQAKINGYIFSQTQEIKTLTINDIELDETQTGIQGSPTYVSSAFRPDINRKSIFINGDILTKSQNLIKELNTNE